MLTALISLLSGLVSGVLPDVMAEVRESRASRREREFLELQHRMQLEAAKIQAEDKLRESEQISLAAELKSHTETLTALFELQGKPSGVRWIDGLNALLRPVAVIAILGLFVWVSYTYANGVLTAFDGKKMTVDVLNAAIWGSILGESFLAVLGFLFGYRSARKA